MRKPFVISFFLIMLFSTKSFAQPQVHNIYMPGFQRAKITLEDIGYKATCHTHNVTFNGLVINNKGVFHCDVGYILNYLIMGLNAPKRIESGVFEAGLGTNFARKEKSCWAWSADVHYRGLNATNFTIDSIERPSTYTGTIAPPVAINTNYLGIGGTIYYVRSVAKFLVVTPEFGWEYGGSNYLSKRAPRAHVALSLSMPFSESGWGLAASFGAYSFREKYDKALYGEDMYKAVGVKYMKFGITKTFSK